MSELPRPIEKALSIGYVLKMAAPALVDRIDTKYADRINGPEDWPRIHIDHVEAPCATEEELGGAV